MRRYFVATVVKKDSIQVIITCAISDNFGFSGGTSFGSSSASSFPSAKLLIKMETRISRSVIALVSLNLFLRNRQQQAHADLWVVLPASMYLI